MLQLKCPVCGGILARTGPGFRCDRGHSYDMARQGYVNLLMSNRSSAKRHGDDRLMVAARQEFLDAGHYDCLRDGLCRLAAELCSGDVVMADAGCGEGFYTAAVKNALEQAGHTCHALGRGHLQGSGHRRGAAGQKPDARRGGGQRPACAGRKP